MPKYSRDERVFLTIEEELARVEELAASAMRGPALDRERLIRRINNTDPRRAIARVAEEYARKQDEAQTIRDALKAMDTAQQQSRAPVEPVKAQSEDPEGYDPQEVVREVPVWIATP